MLRDEIEVTAADHRTVAAEIRAAVDDAVTKCAADFGVVHAAAVRANLPPWATGPQIGARMNGLIRSGHLVWTGGFELNGNTKTRNALRPCKVYRLVKPIGGDQ